LGTKSGDKKSYKLCSLFALFSFLLLYIIAIHNWPLIRPRDYGARGKASMLRDKLWGDFRLRRLYKLRGVGEGFFSGFSFWGVWS